MSSELPKGGMVRRVCKALEVPADEEAEMASSRWINRDIMPLPPSRRKWGAWSFVGYWCTTGITITGCTTRTAGSSLLSLGLNVWQAMIAIIIGQSIVGMAVVLTGMPGGEWHIGFPVISRASWGLRGGFFPLINRIILSVTWYSTQAWFGGGATKVVIAAIWPSFATMKNTLPASAHMETNDFIAFLVFCTISLPLIYMAPERYRKPFLAVSVIMTLTCISLLIWALAKAGGGGSLLTNTSALLGVEQVHGTELGWQLANGVSATLGGICAGILSQADYARFAQKPTDPVISQVLVVPLSSILNALVGILVTSCAAQFYPNEGLLWEPYKMLAALQQYCGPGARAAVFFAGSAFVLGQLGINVAGNALSGGIDMSCLSPKYINIRRGGYITAALAVLIQPWQLLNGAGTYLKIMGSYAVFLGPMTGILLFDYWLLRSRKFKLRHLYEPSSVSIYWYHHGFNWRAPVAWILGVWPLMPGFVSYVKDSNIAAAWQYLYYLSWPLGFTISASSYYLFSRVWPPVGLGEVDAYDYYGTFGSIERPYGSGSGSGLDLNADSDPYSTSKAHTNTIEKPNDDDNTNNADTQSEEEKRTSPSDEKDKIGTGNGNVESPPEPEAAMFANELWSWQ